MIYGNKFYNYGMDSLSESVVLSDEFNNLNNIIESLNESSTVVINEANFGDMIKNVFATIGKVIVKVAAFIKEKVLAFFGKIKGFFDKIVNSIKKTKTGDNSRKSSDSSTSPSTTTQTTTDNDFDKSFSEKELKNVVDVCEEMDKSSEELAQIKMDDTKVDNKSQEEDSTLKNIDDMIENKEHKINSATIVIKKYSDEFDKIADEYLLKSFAELHNTNIYGTVNDPVLWDEEFGISKRYYDDHDDYMDNLPYITKKRDDAIKEREDLIKKYIEPFKPFKSNPSKCFTEEFHQFTYTEGLNNQSDKDKAANMFKTASVFFMNEIKRVKNVESYLKWLKEQIDKMQPDGKHADYYKKYPKMIEVEKPVLTCETRFYKENLQACTFLTKQCMSAMKTNVVSGMKFILLAREW